MPEPGVRKICPRGHHTVVIFFWNLLSKALDGTCYCSLNFSALGAESAGLSAAFDSPKRPSAQTPGIREGVRGCPRMKHTVVISLLHALSKVSSRTLCCSLCFAALGDKSARLSAAFDGPNVLLHKHPGSARERGGGGKNSTERPPYRGDVFLQPLIRSIRWNVILLIVFSCAWC
jgi:hypothetical protein